MNRTPRNISHIKHLIILVLALLSFSAMQAEGLVASDSSTCIKEQSLTNVVVKRERPHMKIGDNGSIIYDAKQISQYRPITNALDILKEIPLIDFNKNSSDKIEIVGTAKADIIINGHKPQMTNEEIFAYLSTLSPSQIKSIEIYSAAPPQFGTTSGAINIIMDQKRTEKVEANGSAWASLYQGSNFYHTGGVNSNIFTKKWILYSSFSLGNLRAKKVYTLYANHNVDGEVHRIVNPSTRYTNNHAIKVATDFTYDFSKTKKLNITCLYRTDNPCYRFTSPLWIDSIQDSHNKGNFWSSKHTSAFMASYESNGWKVGAELLLARNSDKQEILNDDETPALNSGAEQKNVRGTFYFNNTQKVGKNRLSYGTEAQWANVHNAFSNTWRERMTIKNTGKNNTQKEQQWRTFCGWTHTSKSLVTTANLSVEYFKSTRTQDGKTQTLWDKFTLEPNFIVNYKIGSKHSLIGSLATSRTYPKYLNTSGRTAYYNSYYYIANSTKVESYTSYTTTIKFVTSNKYVVGCYSIIEPNAYIQFLYQDPHQLSAGQQFYNIAQYNRHGLLAVIPHSWSTNFDSRLTAYINYITSRGKVNDVSFNKNTFGTRLVLTNNIILDRKRTAALQLNASYNSDILMGYSYNEEMFETALSLTWKPKNTGWNVVLKCNDILNTSKLSRVTKHQLQSSKITQLRDTRKVNLTVRYSLKGYKDKKIKEADTSRIGI